LRQQRALGDLAFPRSLDGASLHLGAALRGLGKPCQRFSAPGRERFARRRGFRQRALGRVQRVVDLGSPVVLFVVEPGDLGELGRVDLAGLCAGSDRAAARRGRLELVVDLAQSLTCPRGARVLDFAPRARFEEIARGRNAQIEDSGACLCCLTGP
jgi:hypothetical protein